MSVEKMREMIEATKTMFGIATDKQAMEMIEKIMLSASAKIEA